MILWECKFSIRGSVGTRTTDIKNNQIVRSLIQNEKKEQDY